MSNAVRKFHLDKRRSKWLGVCAGIADWTGINVTLIRILTVLGTILGSGLLLVAYIIVALVAKPRPFGA